MTKKVRVGILFGGRSAEHEVSLQSAKSIIDALDKDKYDVLLIGIGKDGRWFLNDSSRILLEADNPRLIKLNNGNKNAVALIPGQAGEKLVHLSSHEPAGQVDVIFPILHGPFGEDGTVQGLLKLANVPFVGAGVLGSAVGMDKDVMKRLLRDAGLPIARFMVVKHKDLARVDFEKITKELGLPVFVKPANLGSSVGVSKAKDKASFLAALEHAFAFDNKVIIEEFVKCREIECSVLGNEDPIASFPGEIVPQHEFYSYDAKYIDENGAVLKIPAQLSDSQTKAVQHLAIEAFKVLCCQGMARVDLFLNEDGKFFVNEINTIPGFTKVSMYPKLWEASGIPYSQLIDRLIELAVERFQSEQKLQTEHL